MSQQVATAYEPRFRILIVDDDDDVREALQDELEAAYDVTSVTSGLEALRCLDKERYDAIISDQRMPGMSGVSVLEEARNRDANLVRILLTGYVDEDARRAMLKEGAPYKIGKPWHDEVEVTLKRAFEHREREKSLIGSVTEALAVAGIDDELAVIESTARLAQVIVRRCLSLREVQACYATMVVDDETTVLAGHALTAPCPENAWRIELPIRSDNSVQLVVQGTGTSARDIAQYLAKRALHWSSDDAATRLARHANSSRLAQERLSAVSRRATLGTMTAALVHELASVVQSIQGSLFELEDFVRTAAAKEDDEEIVDTLEDAVNTCGRMIALFRATRTFVRAGDVHHRPCAISDLMDRSVALCKGHLRSVVKLQVSDPPPVAIQVNEALFLQVLVNLLRNAAEASEQNGVVEFDARVENGNAIFSVRDHGTGVPEDLVNEMFDPFTTSKEDRMSSGLGLSISSEIVGAHCGTIRYEAPGDGGSLFTVTVPLTQPDRE